jgi:ubiquinone/menaquinone biosynthesis C-methylase UbiE
VRGKVRPVSLFQGTAEFYREFRSGVPADVAAILIDAAPDRRPRNLLDVGTGTGYVIEALQDDVDDVIGIDVDDDLLMVARSSLRPRPGQQLAFVRARAEDFTPPEGWTADLVTICRTFHWLERPVVLDRLDSIVAPDGVVAILGDNSIWADNAGWKSEIKTILAEFLGQDRRAGQGTYQRPPRPYAEDLSASMFSDWEQHTVPVRRERSLDSVIGYLHSTSFATPALFADRLDDFHDAVRERLPALAENGMYVDHNEFGILVGRRPGAHRRP